MAAREEEAKPLNIAVQWASEFVHKALPSWYTNAEAQKAPLGREEQEQLIKKALSYLEDVLSFILPASG